MIYEFNKYLRILFLIPAILFWCLEVLCTICIIRGITTPYDYDNSCIATGCFLGFIFFLPFTIWFTRIAVSLYTKNGQSIVLDEGKNRLFIKLKNQQNIILHFSEIESVAVNIGFLGLRGNLYTSRRSDMGDITITTVQGDKYSFSTLYAEEFYEALPETINKNLKVKLLYNP